ncbi:MAG: hypothetical protein ACOX5F_01795 [Anaerovoracaceae bacterium]|jgi:hypothetical protein
MDKRTMKFKLLSYKQALKKAYDKKDEAAVKRWKEGIDELQKEINEAM